MRDGETLVNIQITEAAQIVAPQMNSQDTSSVSGKASLPAESKNSSTEIKGGKNKSISPKTCIIISIWSALSACTIGLLTASLTVNKLKNSLIWDFKLWKWFLLLAIIICGGLGIFLLVKTVEWLIINIWHNVIVVYYFFGVKKAMVVFFWVALIFMSWFLLFDRETKLSKDTNKIASDISRGLGGCIIGVAIWLVKTVLVKLIASFHVKNLFDKFTSINRRRKILEPLSKKEKEEPESEKDTKENVEDMISVLKHIELRPLSCYSPQKKFKDETDEHRSAAADEIFMKFALSPSDKFADLEEILKFLDDGEEKQHFEAVAEDKQAILVELKKDWEEEILKFLKDEEKKQYFQAVAEDKQARLMELKKDWEEKQHAEAEAHDKKEKLEELEKHIEAVQKTKQKALIRKSIFRIWVVDILREYDSVNSVMKNKKTAVDELNKLASTIVLIIIAVAWLLCMQVLGAKTIFFICSHLVLAAFVFGNTARTIFEAVIFVFVMHPFDVGDRCVVDGVQMEITKTTFLKYDNERIYYPNSVLVTKPISNLYRSPNMWDTFEFTVDFSTPKDKLENLRKKIERYLGDHSRRWGDHSLQFKEIENMNKLKVVLYVSHKINFHDALKRGKRRSILVLDMKGIFEELEIKYNHLPQPVHLSYTDK